MFREPLLNTPLLCYQHIYAGYGNVKALHDVCLEVYKNEIVTLIGANGAGKSTLLMSTYSQPRIKSGSIQFNGLDIHHLPTHQIHRLGIAIAPERRRIFDKMTTEENLQMGAIMQSHTELKKSLSKIYTLFPILAERKNQRAGTLSGGEQQMLSMGRGLMNNPKLFLLDEPSLGLSPQMVTLIFKTLKEIAASGTTLLLVEQNAHHALQLANRAYVLVNGEIQLSGKSSDILNNPAIQTAYLGMPA